MGNRLVWYPVIRYLGKGEHGRMKTMYRSGPEDYAWTAGHALTQPD